MTQNDEVILDFKFFMTGKINAPSNEMYTHRGTAKRGFARFQ